MLDVVETKTVFRIENPNTRHGMWYRLDGTYDPFIMTLTEGISKGLPMGFHERYSKNGRKWFSAGKSRENMNGWFSALDAQELYDAGYKLFRFIVSEFVEEEHQVLFTQEGVLECLEIPLSDIWEIRK